MFSYFGSKSKIIKHYPKPVFDTVIEPFSGSAAYARAYPHKNVVLVEKDPIIAGIWDWLIKDATVSEIKKYSEFRLGDSIEDLPIDPRHRNFLGLCINRGSITPKNIVTKWSCQSKIDPEFASTVKYRLERACEQLKNIRHWSVEICSYDEFEFTGEATWFIDPPYEKAGIHYTHGSDDIDFKKLGEWCKSRQGQVIVCENSDATWLDFKPLVDIKGCAKFSSEAIWIK